MPKGCKVRGRSLLWLPLIALAMLTASAAPAAAHAGLVASSPSSGTGLPQAPGAVVLRFSEPLNRRLSHIDVRSTTGADAATAPTAAVTGDVRAMQRKLGLLRPGQYTVRWTSVSTLDGHVLRGNYTFGVGSAGGLNQAVQSNPVASEGPLGLVGRLGGLVGLTLWAGVVLLAGVAARAGVAPGRVRSLRRLAPVLVLAGTGLSVVSSALVATGSLSDVGGVLFASRSGELRATLLAVSALGALVGPLRWARPLGVVLAPVALLVEAASGHAAATPLPALTTASFAVHLGAVGVWIFAITACLLTSGSVRDALDAFTPFAVGAAVLVGITGSTNAVLELSQPRDLIKSGYGLAVVGKGVAFLSMAIFGYAHYWARLKPNPSPPELHQPLRLEAGAAVVALVVATLLVGFPNPPREAAAAERLEAKDPALVGLRNREALSLADASGPFIVGLTVLPPRPGPTELRVQVLGVEAGDALRAARVRATPSPEGPGVEALLKPCGLGCFAGRSAILHDGTWRFEVSITSNRGPVSMAVTVPLPMSSGRDALNHAFAAMEALRSARMHEDLTGSVGGPRTMSDYQFQAPNAFAFQVNGSEEVNIGSKTYRRDDPTQPWSSADAGFLFTWPADYYRQFWGPGVAARLLGTEDVDGVASQVVAFARPELPAWFRVWIGIADGLVRREQMRAEGHLMDHIYRDFNQPMGIRPPI